MRLLLEQEGSHRTTRFVRSHLQSRTKTWWYQVSIDRFLHKLKRGGIKFRLIVFFTNWYRHRCCFPTASIPPAMLGEADLA